MSLKDELNELEARRIALGALLKNPRASAAEKAVLQQHLDDVLVVQKMLAEDMAADPAGYRAWLWAEGNAALLKQTRRFRQ